LTLGRRVLRIRDDATDRDIFCIELLDQPPLSVTHDGDSQGSRAVIHHGKQARVSMAAAIELRGDFTGDDLRRLARSSRDAKQVRRQQVRRLLAQAAVCDGGTRTEAARIGGIGLQIVRDWVVRFNAEGPDGLIDRKAPGKAPTLTPAQRAALAGAVEVGPEPWRDGVVRWRLIDLVQWLWDEFRVSVSEATVGRELRALGFRKLSARPRHYAQDPEAAEAFKKVSRSAWRRSAPRIPASA
jgi:transposase